MKLIFFEGDEQNFIRSFDMFTHLPPVGEFVSFAEGEPSYKVFSYLFRYETGEVVCFVDECTEDLDNGGAI